MGTYYSISIILHLLEKYDSFQPVSKLGLFSEIKIKEFHIQTYILTMPPVSYLIKDNKVYSK